MKTISIIVPVYFNEGSLPGFFSEFQAIEQRLVKNQYLLELIFVDDGSQDGSLNELLKIKEVRPQTKIIKLTRNFGSVHASKTGMQFVTGDCFVVLPADLQDPPELLLQMLGHWEAGHKFVICTRRSRGDGMIAKTSAKIYYWLLRKLVVPDYPKGGFDVALMDKVFLPYMLNSSKNINTPLFAYWLGFKPVNIPYDRRPRIHGRSRWTFSKRIKFFLDSLLGFSVVPIRLISLVGLFVSLISFSYGTSIVMHALFVGRDVPGFATLAALICFLLGLITVMLGVIGEYLWRIFDEVNKRPESVIDQSY